MRRAIVVTGCSSGIGLACAARLTRAGFRVFAGVRPASDRRALSGLATPLELDVSSADSVTAASEIVGEAQ